MSGSGLRTAAGDLGTLYSFEGRVNDRCRSDGCLGVDGAVELSIMGVGVSGSITSPQGRIKLKVKVRVSRKHEPSYWTAQSIYEPTSPEI